MAKMSAVWDRTGEFLSEKTGTLTPLALIAFFVPASISTNLDVIGAGAAMPTRLLLMGISLLLSVLSFWGSLTVMQVVLAGGPVGAAAGVAGRRLPAALLVSLVLGAGLALLFVPVTILLALRGFDLRTIAANGAQMSVDAQTAAILGLYLVVVLLILLFLFARLSVVSAVVLHERRLLGAIGRSWRLTRGNNWRILGVLLLLGIVAAIAQLAARTVFGTVFQLVVGGSDGGVPLATVLTGIVVAAVQSVFLLVLAAFQGNLYHALATEAGAEA